ncbi:MAG: hypothetical protein ACOCU4_10715 [Alkalispirochaeta sp.]
MATVQTWLDRWVEDERSVPRRTSRFPDDVARLWGVERPNSAPGDGSAAGEPGSGPVGAERVDRAALAGFRRRTRRRREFLGLSLQDLSALGGASEEESAGCLSIRDDLPSAEYLTVPFVRRAWRVLWLLDDGGGVHFEFGPASALQAITFDWRLTRCLDMDPRTAHYNLKRLLQILSTTGFLDENDSHGLSSRSYELIRAGRVGAFYKALLLRLCNRYPWEVHDGLPPLRFVQYNALFMAWLLTHAEDRSIQAGQIQRFLSALARSLQLESDDVTWSDDDHLVERAVQERFLKRVGRMLGLCDACLAPDGLGWYRATPFAGRVLRWQR